VTGALELFLTNKWYSRDIFHLPSLFCGICAGVLAPEVIGRCPYNAKSENRCMNTILIFILLQ